MLSAVVAEIQQYGETDLTFQALQSTEWLRAVETGAIAEPVLACNLDPGESAVLTWAYHHPNTEAVLDDLAARRCAERLQIPTRGTLGLVLLAVERSAIYAYIGQNPPQYAERAIAPILGAERLS